MHLSYPQDNVIDGGDIATGNLAIAILVAVKHLGVLTEENVVVERGYVTTGNLAVAINVAGNRGLDRIVGGNTFANEVYAYAVKALIVKQDNSILAALGSVIGGKWMNTQARVTGLSHAVGWQSPVALHSAKCHALAQFTHIDLARVWRVILSNGIGDKVATGKSKLGNTITSHLRQEQAVGIQFFL